MEESESAALARALEESALEAQQQSGVLLLALEGPNGGQPCSRTSLPPPLEHHFGARRGRVAVGGVRTFGGVNQFHAAWQPLIAAHATAGSLCGYVSVANALLLQRAAVKLASARAQADAGAGAACMAAQASLTEHELLALVASVRDAPVVMALAESEMERIAGARRAYLDTHSTDFSGGVCGVAARSYLRAWVANYEISDGLRGALSGAGAAASAGSEAAPVFFIRHNQFPELGSATHEERARIGQDEARFGGRKVPTGDGQDAASGESGVTGITYGADDSIFFLERFWPEHRLETPDEWRTAESLAPAPLFRVFVIDLNGHFSAGISCVTAEGGNTVVLVNSTETVYEDCPMMQWLYDLVFDPGSSGCEISGEPGRTLSDVSQTQLAEIVAMGFPRDAAENALRASHGVVARAVDALLGAA